MRIITDDMTQPLDGASPSGRNEEYSPIFLELPELAVGVAPSQMGDSVTEGRNPDWLKLRENCGTLWQTTRDLRVAVYLTIAGFALDGLAGLSDGLTLVRFLVGDMWETFYPVLDPDDDNDPLERLNTLAMLSPAPGSFHDPIMFINRFRTLRLAEQNRYTLRDYMIASGELDAGDEKVDAALMQAEMRMVPLPEIQEKKKQIGVIREQLNDIASIVDTHTGSGTGIFAALLAELKTLDRFYDPFLCPMESTEPSAAPESPDASPSPVPGPAGHFDISSATPRNRADALLFLQRGAEYFQKSEPTSPVPFLVRRALRMADMNFLDLLGDIEPGAMERGREILGVKANAENGN